MPKQEPKEKKSRAVGTNLFLKGERSFSPKSAVVKKPYPPGVHGKKRRRRVSEYGQQLIEKQKIKWSYGLREAQFKNYFKEASRAHGATGELMMQKLELRLDNVVYRLGFAISRSVGRQLVSHGHILVNDKKVMIPSYQVKPGDVVLIRPQSRGIKPFEDLAVRLQKYEPPEWLRVAKDSCSGKVIKLPPFAESVFDMGLVVDFYSR
ncbi:MAG: 30S ribosomal protein S4 [Parcubacteria group bacterium RIFCSPLOWO2_01_FULL_48_18]|nr:MAG: 30S ribosomal protein S4 [Parcubacteria group bacterium RIFCSPLOWO2_01_FULL_48_18]